MLFPREPDAHFHGVGDRTDDGTGATSTEPRAEQYRLHALLAAGRGRAGHLPGLRRQVGPVPAAGLVARRHGRPDAGQRPDPRGDDGGGRRLPGRPLLPAVHARGAAGHRLHRRHHAVRGRHHRRRHDRHQEGAGLLDGQPARLHDAGPGRRRLGGRAVPPAHARLLQGPAVPRLGQRHLRLPSRAGHDARWAACIPR